MAYTCLFAEQGHDLRPWLKEHTTTGQLQSALKSIWQQRRDRYSEEREQQRERVRQPAEMAYLGG